MKKRLAVLTTLIVTLILCVCGLTACGGEEVKQKVNFIVDGETYASIDTSGNEKIKIPEDPAKEGYEFDGWYLDEDTWQKPVTKSTFLNITLKKDVNVYAKWLARQFVLTIVYGNDSPNKVITQDCGSEIESIADPIKKGYTFTGWSEDIPETMPAENKTITAGWRINQYTLIIVFGDGKEDKVITQNYGTEINYELPTTLTRVGYTFTGWSESIPTTMPAENKTITANWKVNQYTLTIVYNNGESDKVIKQDFGTTINYELPTTLTRDGYTFNGWSDDIPEIMPAENRTISALWKINNYTLTIVYNNGENDKVIKQDFGTAIESVATPTKVGYTFNGWSESIPSVMPAENKIITANWKVNQYTITLVLDNGESDKVIKQDFGTAIESVENPTKVGYTFNGWSESIPTTMPAENKIIIANWLEIFTLNGNEITGLAAHGKTLSEISIPSNIDGVNVTSVGNSAFYGCTSLTSVVIGNSVTSIGSYAFAYCDSLTSVVVGNGVTSIGEDAFYYCAQLSSVNYTGTIDTWSQIEFANATANPTYYSKNLYINDVNVLIGAIKINGSTIGAYAFLNCDSLTSVSIGTSVTSIGNSSFSGCTSLTSMEIPNSVTSIGENAFYNCSSLTSITLPFVGASATATGYQRVFGYIFGYTTSDSSSTITGATYQYYVFSSVSGHTYYHYYIPQSLKIVVITGGTIIDSHAFKSCCSLTSITIPNSVTSIGVEAFYKCSSLTSIEIPSSVTKIERGAFTGCNSLTSVNYLGGIDQWAQIDFADSTSNPLHNNRKLYINNILVTEVNLITATLVSEYAFSGYRSLTRVTIGNSVTSIGSYAFDGCSKLANVIFENDSVTSIGNYAFWGCSSLTSIEIPDSVTSIGYNAFSNCDKLTSVVLGNSVESIGSYAFFYCDSLTSVEIGSGVTSIGYDAFCNCYRLVEVINKSPSITVVKGSEDNGYLGYYAVAVFNSTDTYVNKFINDNGYIIYNNGNEKVLCRYEGTETDLILPSYITAINKRAFYECSSLTSVSIGNSVTSIGSSAFYDCYKLTSVVIGNSVTTIGEYAFAHCSSLTSIEIPNSVTSIGNSAFCNCYRLVEVINKSPSITVVKGSEDNGYLGYYAVAVFNSTDTYVNKFINDNGYIIYNNGNKKVLCRYEGAETTLTLPSFITAINNYAFSNCDSLTSIEIGSGVTSIGEDAFYDCDSLTSVVIPNSVTSIGDNAFAWCSKLTSVVIGNSVTSIGYGAFEGCSSLTSVVIPDSVTSIGEYAFRYCSKLTSIEIPGRVISIRKEAFYGCSSLTSINYCGTQSQWLAISKGDDWDYKTGNYTITYNYGK